MSVTAAKKHIVFGLYGAGGFAREVMPLVAEHVAAAAAADPQTTWEVCFVETHPGKSEVNGIRLVSEAQFLEMPCSQRYFNIAIGDSKVRQRIAEACLSKGAVPLTLRSAHAVVYSHNDIAEGAVLCANTIVTSNARIGRFFHANLHSYVAHDCVIGDFVTFAPNVHCNGNVHVHDHAYIGTGAIIKQGSPDKPTVIGEGAVVGMGAVVTKDVAPYTTVVGNPAKPMAPRA